MKKWMIALLAVVILLTALCLWQRNNIKALYLFITNDEAGVEQIIEDNRKELEDKIKEYGEDMPRNFTPEEEAKIASGEISVEEAVELLLGEETSAEENEETLVVGDEETSADVPEENQTPEVKEENNSDKADSKDKTKEKNTGSDIIKKYTAKFYSLKAYYLGQLGSIESQAKSDYSALTKEQKKSLSKTAFASKYINYALSLESECDSQVESLLAEMKTELTETGADTSVIGVIRQAYNSEKAAKKADYMSILK